MSNGSASSRGACASGKVSLPVMNTSAPQAVARSKAARWRAAVLILVHVLIIAHVVQWLATGRTLSPVEPSESIETIKWGYLNAGFVFFATAIAATVALGRFVCGWGCHLVAYQDLCAWLLRKIRIRPKPFRSRLLIFVPLGAAFYMFAWPQVYMWINGIPRPPASDHFATAQLWRTFPGLGIALLTVAVCGFLIIYFLGNKGFCTYACPYGAFFGLADKLAVGRIRVTDACEGCGHCTSVCTSNVRVHEQVRDYGMVVDPGCMKCFDCVTVCPNDALYYGFGKPSLFKTPRTKHPTDRKRRYDFTWPEELLMAGAFGATLLAFRGLYDAIPFLLALGIGVISAYLAVQLLRMATRANVRLHAWQLKYGGRVRPAGWGFAALMTAWLALTAHSGLVRYHTWRGLVLFDEAQIVADDGAEPGPRAPGSVNEAARRALAHLSFSDRWGLVDTVIVNMKLAWLHILRGEPVEAEQRLLRVIEMKPDDAEPRLILGNLCLQQGQFDRALQSFALAAQLHPEDGLAHFNVGLCTARLGRLEDAAAAFRRAIEAGLDNPQVHWNLGSALASLQRTDEAISQFAAAAALDPDFAAAHYNGGVLLLTQGKTNDAIAKLRRAVELAPTDAEAHYVLGQALIAQGDHQNGQHHLRMAGQLDPRFRPTPLSSSP